MTMLKNRGYIGPKDEATISLDGVTIPSDDTTEGSTLDFGAAKAGRMPFRAVVNFTGAAGGTSATFAVQGSDNGSSWSTIYSSATSIVTANMGLHTAAIGGDVTYRYYRINVTGVGTFTAGTVDAWIAPINEAV
jgi:hypothetical protein